MPCHSRPVLHQTDRQRQQCADYRNRFDCWLTTFALRHSVGAVRSLDDMLRKAERQPIHLCCGVPRMTTRRSVFAQDKRGGPRRTEMWRMGRTSRHAVTRWSSLRAACRRHIDLSRTSSALCCRPPEADLNLRSGLLGRSSRAEALRGAWAPVQPWPPRSAH